MLTLADLQAATAVSLLDASEWVGKVGGALLVVIGIGAAIKAGVKQLGAAISGFVNEKVLPPITALTSSVDDLAERTHENTVAFEGFAKQQGDINLKTATELALLRGRLGMDAD